MVLQQKPSVSTTKPLELWWLPSPQKIKLVAKSTHINPWCLHGKSLLGLKRMKHKKRNLYITISLLFIQLYYIRVNQSQPCPQPCENHDTCWVCRRCWAISRYFDDLWAPSKRDKQRKSPIGFETNKSGDVTPRISFEPSAENNFFLETYVPSEDVWSKLSSIT